MTVGVVRITGKGKRINVRGEADVCQQTSARITKTRARGKVRG